MKLVPLMTLIGRVDAPVEIGRRRIFNAIGGEFEGDRLRGKVLPNGGEWFLQNEEDVGQVNVRLLLLTDDGAHIYVRYTGVLETDEAAMAALSEGRSTNFGDTRFLTQVRFEASDPRYAWLTSTIAVGEGRMHPDCVEYAIYEVAHSSG